MGICLPGRNDHPLFQRCHHQPELWYDPIHDSVGWYFGNAGKTTHPVAMKLPNPWNLYDMHGNVWEWCQDYYGALDPSPSSGDYRSEGPSFGWGRVFKGGSWGFVAHCSRAANRKWVVPTFPSDNIGFRLVMDLPIQRCH
jgi:formylglycine-generating enzyme required for sulfatase activity